MRRTDEEIIALASKMADYIIETKNSTRTVAKHFNVSVFTVSSYMNNKLSKNDPRYAQVHEILESHQPILDKDRILKELELLMQGYNCLQISEIVGVSNSQISLDFSENLAKIPGITKEILIKVKEKLKQNSYMNLQIGSNMSVQNQPRENGRFK